MLKVCHFTVAHDVADPRIFEKECKSLYAAGYDVSLVVPNIEDSIVSGIKIYGVRVSMNPVARLLFGAKKVYIKALELDADIYHFHDIELFKYGIKLKKKGKKVIFDSHENWIDYIMDIKWLPAMIKKYMSWTVRRMYKKYLSVLDAVITVSPHIVDILKQYAPNIYMISNYPIISSNDLAFFSKMDYLQRKNRICYSGTVYAEISNQEYILEALEAIEDAEYVMVGTINPKYRKVLSSFRGWDKASFIENVSRQKLYQIYDTVLAGVVIFDYTPNLGYKQGSLGVNKIFEYMMKGLPIISSDQEMWKQQIIDKYKCGICVKPRDIDGIREAIIQILNNRELAYEMGQNGVKAVIEEFNWKTQEKILLDVYSHVTEDI
ncbi:MAG: glycosyltransferase [Bacteroidales bacterium]|nr:glycosyltransferase [Bacteroidales bacterium]